MPELKPCPFCGCAAVINHRDFIGTWIVECSNNDCPASYMIGNSYETEEKAIDAWNRRVNND